MTMFALRYCPISKKAENRLLAKKQKAYSYF